ncbi:MAG TPA: ferredoxin [Streptosporangiaceae bacterium]|nr:ferredoxin [Streptosporangiaceae bacterium]
MHRLEVNPIACDGRGLCAELLPEVIEIDEWGYPILTGNIPGHLASLARRAVRACPALALRLTDIPAEPPPGRRAGDRDRPTGS